jgi:hypothetical protein
LRYLTLLFEEFVPHYSLLVRVLFLKCSGWFWILNLGGSIINWLYWRGTWCILVDGSLWERGMRGVDSLQSCLFNHMHILFLFLFDETSKWCDGTLTRQPFPDEKIIEWVIVIRKVWWRWWGVCTGKLILLCWLHVWI